MSPHDRIVDTSRQTQGTVRVVAGVYVAIGLVLTFYSANEGHVVNTFIGFLIVNLAIVGGLVVVMLMRLGERVSLMADRLDHLDHAIGRIESSIHHAEIERRESLATVVAELRLSAPELVSPDVHAEEGDERSALLDEIDAAAHGWPDEAPLPSEEQLAEAQAVCVVEEVIEEAEALELDQAAAAAEQPGDEAIPPPADSDRTAAALSLPPMVPVVESVDLAAVGMGDPALLAAAVLDRDRFPRLAAILEEPAGDESSDSASSTNGNGATPHAADVYPAADGVTSVNMMRRWGVAMRDGDLGAAREVFSALVDTADADWVSDMRRSLDDLTRRIEGRLRDRFAGCVRDGDFEGALAVGDEIRLHLADRPIAGDFARIEPHILRKLGRSADRRDLVPS
jgi:hypothetical protein